jgi:integrase
MGLTAAKVKALLAQATVSPPAKRATYADGDVEGLVLRITSNGVASWSVEYTRPTGGRARYTIGPAAEIGLAAAREKARDIRALARDGADPHFDRRKARRRANQGGQITDGTVADLARQYFESREAKSWRPATRDSFESLLNRHVLPAIGRTPATEVLRADVRALLERVHDQTAIGSNRVFELVRAMYNWARSKDVVAASPCDGVKKIEKERRRERTYTDEELRTIAEVVAATDLEDLVAFLMRTGARSHEARAARWELVDFDRKVWTIPAEEAKAGRKHEVPLAPGAWAILDRRFKKYGGKAFVFPARTRECGVCLQGGHERAPLNRKMRELSIAGGLLRNTGTGERPKWEGELIRLHDIRRTVADRMLNVLGVAPYVVDLGVLGHAPAGLIRTYMPSGIGLPEVQVAMCEWDAHLDTLLAGESRKARASVTHVAKGPRRDERSAAAQPLKPTSWATQET